MLAAEPTIAFAEIDSPEPPDAWLRSLEDIDDGGDTDVEVLMDESTSWVEEGNRNAVEEESIVMLELGVRWAVDSDILDSAARLGIVYPAAL